MYISGTSLVRSRSQSLPLTEEERLGTRLIWKTGTEARLYIGQARRARALDAPRDRTK